MTNKLDPTSDPFHGVPGFNSETHRTKEVMNEELSTSMAKDIVERFFKDAGIIQDIDALTKAIAESIQATFLHAKTSAPNSFADQDIPF